MRHFVTHFAIRTKDPQFLYTLSFGLVVGGIFWLNAPDAWLSNLITSPVYILKLVVLHPLFEELVFRGGIQGELLKRRRFKKAFIGVSLSNFATSLIFATMHTFSQPFEIAALTLVPSLVFGYFRERHSWLLTPIILHMYFNGLYILFSWVTRFR